MSTTLKYTEKKVKDKSFLDALDDGDKDATPELDCVNVELMTKTVTGYQYILSFQEKYKTQVENALKAITKPTPKFSDLPEDVKDKIFDAMSIHDVGTWSTISTSERQRVGGCLLYTSPSPRDRQKSRMPSSA